MIAPNIQGSYPNQRSDADQLALNTQSASQAPGIVPSGYVPQAPAPQPPSNPIAPVQVAAVVPTSSPELSVYTPAPAQRPTRPHRRQCRNHPIRRFIPRRLRSLRCQQRRRQRVRLTPRLTPRGRFKSPLCRCPRRRRRATPSRSSPPPWRISRHNPTSRNTQHRAIAGGRSRLGHTPPIPTHGRLWASLSCQRCRCWSAEGRWWSRSIAPDGSDIGRVSSDWT